MEKFDNFLKTYGFDFLGNVDIDLHNFCISNFLRFNHQNIDDLIFFDVGSNAGSFIKVANLFGIKNVHAFEPHPILSSFLKENFKSSKVNQLCLSDQVGRGTIFIPDTSVGISSMINRPVFSTLNQKIHNVEVELQTIDNYCNINSIKKIDYIKLDVEGAELKVLQGAINLLSEKRIVGGQAEIGKTLEDAGSSTQELINFIENFGYAVFRAGPNDILFLDSNFIQT